MIDSENSDSFGEEVMLNAIKSGEQCLHGWQRVDASYDASVQHC